MKSLCKSKGFFPLRIWSPEPREKCTLGPHPEPQHSGLTKNIQLQSLDPSGDLCPNASLKSSIRLDKRAAIAGPLRLASTLVRSHHSSSASEYLNLLVPSYPGGTSVVTGWAAFCITGTWYERMSPKPLDFCSLCSQSSIFSGTVWSTKFCSFSTATSHLVP